MISEASACHESVGQNAPMDAGLAAVLGAAVGAIGTGGAAVLTSWWSTASQERQSNRQLRFEHLRERREPRSKAYADVVAHVQRMGRRLDAFNHSRSFPDERPEEYPDPEELDTLADLCARVAVEGPAEVAEQVALLLACAREACEAAAVVDVSYAFRNDDQEDRVERSLSVTAALSEALGRFMAHARLALDDDGSTAPPVRRQGTASAGAHTRG